MSALNHVVTASRLSFSTVSFCFTPSPFNSCLHLYLDVSCNPSPFRILSSTRPTLSFALCKTLGAAWHSLALVRLFVNVPVNLPLCLCLYLCLPAPLSSPPLPLKTRLFSLHHPFLALFVVYVCVPLCDCCTYPTAFSLARSRVGRSSDSSELSSHYASSNCCG